jgi:hypothetical protein
MHTRARLALDDQHTSSLVAGILERAEDFELLTDTQSAAYRLPELQRFSTETCHFYTPHMSLEAMPRGIQHEDVSC